MKTLIPLTSFLLLTACTSYKEGFDCEAVPGVGCRSITEVDKMIDQGKLGLEEETYNEVKASTQEKPSTNVFNQGLYVWIAPYDDGQGVWHESRSLYVSSPSQGDSL